MPGKRPDDWTVERLETMAKMAETMSEHLAQVVRSMKDQEIDSLALQARKKWAALDELLTWSEFDLRKALSRQAMMRAKGSSVAEKKRRRK